MYQWLDLMNCVLEEGVMRPDRTGVGTFSVFGAMLRFELQHGFPATTTKQLAFGQVAAELSAFIRGYDTLEQFHSVGCKIWDGNGKADYWTKSPHYKSEGYLGRIYGVQWRDWRSFEPAEDRDPPRGIIMHRVDQLQNLVEGLKRDPFSRRHLVTAWNPGELDQMCLPPCHVLFQAYAKPSKYLTKKLQLDFAVYMRSVDLFLGLPFDIASYALLQHLVAKEVDMIPGELVFMLGDAHIYLNHQDAVRTVLHREELEPPVLALDPAVELYTFAPDQARLENYQHRGPVPALLNV